MTDEQIAVKFTEHDHEIGSLKHRMADNEGQLRVINDLAMSVLKLALSMESMTKEQQMQSQRLQKLEDEPKEDWKSAKAAIRNTIISVVAGALATGLIFVVAQNVH